MGRCVKRGRCGARKGRSGRWEGVRGARARVAPLDRRRGFFCASRANPRVLAPLITRAETVWVELVAGQSLLLVLNHLVKRSQARVFVNEARWRRLQFDTRLGTYSPR
jgi:hypothetical protein